MHTDEYAITLSREVNICRKKVLQIEKFISGMEAKYNLKTEAFLEAFAKGALEESRDFTRWKEECAALKVWREKKEQYEEIYRIMRF